MPTALINCKKSHEDNVLNYLMEGKSITQSEAISLCGCFRLAAVVHRLRHKHQIPIETRMKKNLRGGMYAEYYIKSSGIQRMAACC